MPLRFYTKNHGKHIKISGDGSSAVRESPGCEQGTVFSAGTVQVDEKVCLRLKIPWNGEIRFGFTAQDPSIKFRSVALHWAVYIVHTEEDYTKQANIVNYYVNSDGVVYYTVDGEEKGWLFTGVPVQSPLWVFMDIHCQGTTVQFVDSMALRQGTIQSPIKNLACEVQSFSENNMVEARSAQLSSNLGEISKATRDGRATTNVASRVVGVTTDMASRDVSVTTDMASRDVGVMGTAGRVGATTALSDASFIDKPFDLRIAKSLPLRFDDVDQSNTSVSGDGTVAISRKDKCNVFSKRPVMINEKVCFRIGSIWLTSIHLGFTALPPSHLAPLTHFTKPLASTFCKQNNILYYYVTAAGDVFYGVNGEDKGILFSGLVMRSYFWALVSMEGRGATIQLIDHYASNKVTKKVRRKKDNLLVQTPNTISAEASRIQVPVEKRMISKREGAAKPGSDRFGEASMAARDGSAIISRVVGVTTNTASRDVSVTTHMASRDVCAVGVTSPPGQVGAGTIRMLSPLSFHSAHGHTLRISGSGSVVERIQPGFQDGDAYSARPVRINEKVCFRFINISCDRKATIRFGFTTRDPATLEYSVPKRQSKYWVWPLAKKFVQKDNTICYYVDLNGEVRFDVNREQKGVFSSNVDTISPFWAIVQINGEGTAIQFEKVYYTQNMRPIQTIQSAIEQLFKEIRPLSVKAPLLKFTHNKSVFIPLRLHSTKGRNIQLHSGFVTRIQGTPGQGYLFTALPMFPSQTIVIQILSVLAPAGRRPGGLAYGLTSCDPAKLRECDLPDDADDLLDRPEYWVVNSNAAEALRRGDELAITLTQNGEFQESRNNSDPITVMHVDQTLKLWAFVDLYESTQRVRMMITQPVETRAQQSRVQAKAPLGSLERPSTSQNPQPTHSTPAASSARQELSETDCSICFDQQIDCALYKCGHMCACYTCAVQLWKDGGGRCPICRAQIKEVIRIFKS